MARSAERISSRAEGGIWRGRGAAGRLVVRVLLAEGAATVMAMEAKGCEEEGKGAPAAQPEPQMRGGLCPVQQMRQERREISWAPGMSWPALRASLMAALSGLLVVEKLSHWGSRASSSSISTAWDLRDVSS